MTLWCVNIHGPDDVIAVASYIEAAQLANRFNSWWQEYRERKPLDDLDARMWAVPIEWPHDAESHAQSLAAPSAEYAGFRSDDPKQRIRARVLRRITFALPEWTWSRALENVEAIQADFDAFDGDRRGISAALWEAEDKLFQLVLRTGETG
jgi:hypothetical protein